MLARSLVKISLICEISSLVCLQTTAARTSGATKGLATEAHTIAHSVLHTSDAAVCFKLPSTSPRVACRDMVS